MNKKSKLRKLLLVAMGLICMIGIQAQQRTITGNVKDAADGSALPGVSVVVKNTTQGTITSFNGDFTIEAEQGRTLVFSFIGYKSQEVTITNQTSINVSLSQDVQDVEEVVVIGYGVQKKSDKTGAVTQIKADELNRGALTDPIQSLQGKASGVMITKKGGDPNSGFSVKIRGASGFDSNTSPLYVIDGIPGVDPTTVAPEDIETFNVLKDAASTAIYGSRSSNGVIIITTKKGKEGKGTVQFNANVSIENVAKKLDLLSADELRAYAKDNFSNFNDGGANTDWQDQIFRTGTSQNYNLNFAGGTSETNYYASLTYSDWEGVMRGTSKERTIGKINISHKALNNRLTLTGGISTTFENNQYQDYAGYDKNHILYQAYSRNPTDPVYNADGSYYKVGREFNYENPLSVINNIENLRDAKRINTNLKADLMIIEGLIGSVNVGYMRNDHENSYYRPKTVYTNPDTGHASKGYNNNSQKLFEGLLNYSTSMNNLHNIDLLAGYSWQESIYSNFFAKGDNPQSDFIKYNNLGALLDVTRESIGSGKGMWRLIGFFARAQYNYDSKYFVSGSIRRDGSSKFGKNNKWGWFPTAAIGWTMSREEFLADTEWLSNLKVRASYGVSGNQEIGEYRSIYPFGPSGTATDPETGKPVIPFVPAWNSNPDLKWEETTEVNLGIDFGFLQNRISGSIEIYKKTTDDLLGNFAVPVPPNLADRTFANSGKLENKGIEFNAQIIAIDNRNFKWKTALSVSHNKQTMKDLGRFSPADGVRKEGYLSGRGLIGDENWVTGIMKGEEFGSFYVPVYMGLDEQGKMQFKSKTGGVTTELGQAQREIVGSATPDVEIGWSNNFTIYKNWTVDLAFRSLIGNDVYNATRMFFDTPANIPNLNGHPDAIKWAKAGRTVGPRVCDLYVEDASFLRLDYVNIGYNFNLKNNWINSLKVSVAANNLFTLTKYSGVDPETSVEGLSYGIDQYNVYPKARTFTFGVSATF